MLMLVALGSNARSSAGGGLSLHPYVVLIAVVCAAIVLAFAALVVVANASFAATRLATKLLLLAAAAALVVGAVALFATPWQSRTFDPHPRVPRPPCGGPQTDFDRQHPEDRKRWCHGGPDGGGEAKVAGGVVGKDASLLVAAAGGTLLVLVLAGILLAIVARRRDARGNAPANEDALLEAVEESLDDLRGERDVRRAVIACYARMERALASVGGARRPPETPFEYLRRMLDRVAGPGGAARVLTELFERAKFSVEPMGEREKAEAITALEELRLGLVG